LTARYVSTELSETQFLSRAAKDSAKSSPSKHEASRLQGQHSIPDLKEVRQSTAAVMAHADIPSTMRYGHATDAGRRRVVEAVTIEAAQPENLVKIWSRKASGSERG